MMKKNILGWVAVSFSLAISCLLAFWGIVENFHEEWHMPSLGENLLGMLRYLLPMFIFMALSLYGVRSPVGGGILYV